MLYPFCFAVFSLIVAVCLDFQQLHNDFWDVYFVARHLNWADKQSWFNPQYPIGYTLFLKAIAGRMLPVVPAILANIFFGFTVVFVSMRFYRKMLAPAFALASVVLLSFFPQFFHYVNVGGGDPGSMAFFTLGAVLILFRFYNSPDSGSSRLFFGAGLLLGVGALFRYHVLVADGMFVLALFMVFPRRWKSLALVSAGVCAAYCPQWAVNIISGHGLLKTQFGPMNVYDLMYGLNWYHATDLKLPSVAHLIGSDPVLFLDKYVHAFWSFKLAWLPPLFAALFEKDARQRKIARAIALWILIYFLMFSAVTSGRQILLPLPFSFLCLGMCLRILWNGLGAVASSTGFRRGIPFGVSGILALGLFALFAGRDLSTLQRRASDRSAFLSIETHLKEEGCSNPEQVFTSDYDLYFRTMPPFIPYFNGGASRLGTYLYNEEFAQFPVDSLPAFVQACRNRGVRYVVLNAESGQLSAGLGALYENRMKVDGLNPDAQFKDRKIYRVLM